MIPLFKAHPSWLSEIMGGIGKPTEKQLLRIIELEQKKLSPKGLTDIQDKELADLITKRDSKPDLQEGAKTRCETWLKEQTGFYGIKKTFTNKFTEKGLICEPDGIEMTARLMRYGKVKKNELQYENDYLIGTPDLVLPEFDIVEENKCSYDPYTFPLFDKTLINKKYNWQCDGYMYLTNLSKAAVSYTLIDTPEYLIEREAYNRKKDQMLREGTFNGFDAVQVESELFELVKYEMTFSNLPDFLRYKRFEFNRNDVAIAAIPEQVKLCRIYIADLIAEIESVRLSAIFSFAQPKPLPIPKDESWKDLPRAKVNSGEPSVIIANHDQEVNATIIDSGLG